MNVITDNLGIGVPPPLVHLASSFRVNEFHSFTWPAFLERYEEMQRSPQHKYWFPKFQDSLPLKMTQFDEFSPSFNLATKRDYNVTYIFLSAQIKEIARLRNFHRKRIILICLKSKNDNMTTHAPLLYQIKEFKRFGENNERSYL